MDVTDLEVTYPHATDLDGQMAAPVVQLSEVKWDDPMGKAAVVLAALSERPLASPLNQEVQLEVPDPGDSASLV